MASVPGYIDPYAAYFLAQGMTPPPASNEVDPDTGDIAMVRPPSRGRAEAESAGVGGARNMPRGRFEAGDTQRSSTGGGTSRDKAPRDKASERLRDLSRAQNQRRSDVRREAEARVAAAAKIRSDAQVKASNTARGETVKRTMEERARREAVGRADVARASAERNQSRLQRLAQERSSNEGRLARERQQAALQASQQAGRRQAGYDRVARQEKQAQVAQAQQRRNANLSTAAARISAGRRGGVNTAAAAQQRKEQGQIDRDQAQLASMRSSMVEGMVWGGEKMKASDRYLPPGWDEGTMGTLNSKQRMYLGAEMSALGPKAILGRAQYGGRDFLDVGKKMSPADVKQLQRQLYYGGFMSDADFAGIQGTNKVGVYDYRTAAAMREVMGFANAQMTDWRAVLGNNQSPTAPGADTSGGSGSSGGRGSRGPLSTTSTVKDIRLTSLDQGSLALRQWMAREMGRVPSDAEVRAYVGRLNEKERANPDIITTTSTENADGSVSTAQKIAQGNAPEPEAEANRYGAEDAGVKQERENFKRASYMGDIMGMLGVR